MVLFKQILFGSSCGASKLKICSFLNQEQPRTHAYEQLFDAFATEKFLLSHLLPSPRKESFLGVN